MLLKIRDKATGWIAYAIVILISIPFALWGIQQYFGLDSSAVAISVDDREITEFQLEQAILEKKRELERNQMDLRFTEEELETEVIGELVSEQLLYLALEKYKLQTTDNRLADYIRNRPEFKVNQRFDVEYYKDLLTKSGFSITGFEQVQRELLKEEQFISMIQGSSFTLPSERQRYIHLADQKREIRYLPINSSYFIEPDSIDVEQAEVHYQANTTSYQSPYKARFDYLEIDVDRLKSEQTVDDDTARTYYEQNADDYLYPEKLNLSHILISTADRDTNTVFSEAEELHQQLIEGADFAELARIHSDDDLTSASGGELPQLTADELENDALRDAVLQLAEGEFTNPIRTQYGVQIFRLDKLIAAKQKPFNKIRKELSEDIKQRMARIYYAKLIENLDLVLFEDEVGFFDAVKQNYGYDYQKTGFIDLNKQENILANPRIREKIISEIVQGGRTNTGLIEVEPGKRAFFVGITGVQPSRQLSFEEAMQDIVTHLILQQAQQRATENNNLWIQEIQAGNTTLKDIAMQYHWSLEEPGYIERTEVSIPRPIVETAFATPPTQKLPLYQTFYLGASYNNVHIIMELLDIEEGAETSQTIVTYSLQNREAVAVLDSLRDYHSVEINVEIEGETEEEEGEAATTDQNEAAGEAATTDQNEAAGEAATTDQNEAAGEAATTDQNEAAGEAATIDQNEAAGEQETTEQNEERE